jgi:putative CocE/NonD family hydrolase
LLRVASLAALCWVAWCAQAQAAPVQQSGYLTMSDGIRLRYTVVLPSAQGRFPVALKYDGYCEGTAPLTCNEGVDAKALLAAGYAVLGVAARGTGCSEGQFDFRSPQESSDGAAAVEWAAGQPWSTGHVGMFGDSFPGLLQPGVAALHPKGLDAIAPWQIVDDLYRDVAYPGGVANGEFAILWAIADQPPASTQSALGGIEAGDPQCAASALEQAVVNPSKNILVSGALSPYVDATWDAKAVGAAASRIDVPAFACQTWQDDETGSRSMWTLWPRLDPARTWAVAANGYHSMCAVSTRIGDELVRFFDRFVKGERNGFETTPHMQIWHETAGAKEPRAAWVTTSAAWPPPTQTDRLYLGRGAALTTASPAGAQPADSFLSPTVSAGTEDGVILGQDNLLWKVPGTPGGAVAYTTPRLAHDAELLGPASLDLWLKATAGDTNLQATITEIRPDGQELYVARGWLRAEQRRLDEAASTPTMPVQTDLRSDVEQLAPGRPTFMRLAILPFDHVFRAGSRIRLIVDTPSQTGGWNFVPNVAVGVDSVLHDAAHPSRLVVGTVPGASAPRGHAACDTLLNQPCRPDAFPASAPGGELDWPRAASSAGGAARPRPVARIVHVRATHRGLVASGTARRAKGGRRVHGVQVSLARRVAHHRCRFLTRAGRFTRARSCAHRTYRSARGSTRWSLRIRHRLARGSYLVAARAVDVRHLHSRVTTRRARVRG